MADIKFTALPAATSLAPLDIMAVVQGGVSKQAAVSLLSNLPAYPNSVAADVVGQWRFNGDLTAENVQEPAGRNWRVLTDGILVEA